jgi:hypothetical protein
VRCCGPTHVPYITKALVLSAGALKPKVTQVDLAEAALAITTSGLSRYLTGNLYRRSGQNQPPAVVAAFAELMTEKGDSREMIVVRAMQIRQRTLDTKAAAKLAKAPAVHNKNKTRVSSPPASISGRAPPPPPKGGGRERRRPASKAESSMRSGAAAVAASETRALALAERGGASQEGNGGSLYLQGPIKHAVPLLKTN